MLTAGDDTPVPMDKMQRKKVYSLSKVCSIALAFDNSLLAFATQHLLLPVRSMLPLNLAGPVASADAVHVRRCVTCLCYQTLTHHSLLLSVRSLPCHYFVHYLARARRLGRRRTRATVR
jgi:hypothetical protein